MARVVSLNKRWCISTIRVQRTGWRRNSPEYGPEFRDTPPLAAMSRKIASLVGDQALTVNALGCGDGKTEAMLVKHLQTQLRMPKQTELFLPT